MQINSVIGKQGFGTRVSGKPANQALSRTGVVRCDSMSAAQKNPNRHRGHRMALDPLAKSASRTEPAFVAKPEGVPVYHGFAILSDVVVDGFTFGKISDFDAEPCTEGDAFVVAPDNSRGGLVWEISDNSYFQEIYPADSDRW